jgi:hypothetical protein
LWKRNREVVESGNREEKGKKREKRKKREK